METGPATLKPGGDLATRFIVRTFSVALGWARADAFRADAGAVLDSWVHAFAFEIAINSQNRCAGRRCDLIIAWLISFEWHGLFGSPSSRVSTYARTSRAARMAQGSGGRQIAEEEMAPAMLASIGDRARRQSGSSLFAERPIKMDDWRRVDPLEECETPEN